MKRIIFFLCIMLIALVTQAQSTLNSTGNSSVINGNIYSYSIGEMTLVHTATASNIVVTQGVLQGSGGTPAGIETVKITEDEFKVFPNPARDVLNMQINFQEKGDLMLKLYDMSGKELYSREWKTTISNTREQLNLQSYAAGNYILNLQYKKDNKTANQSYKIQKLK